MNKTIFLFVFATQILFAQKQDLYIFYDDCSIHKISEIKTDSLSKEVYQVRFGDKVKPEIKFTISDYGRLNKNISLGGVSYPHLSIVFTNSNKNNQPIKINAEEIQNLIRAEDIIYAIDTDFSVFFKNFKNVFLVYSENKESNIKFAKKVEVNYVSAL